MGEMESGEGQAKLLTPTEHSFSNRSAVPPGTTGVLSAGGGRDEHDAVRVAGILLMRSSGSRSTSNSASSGTSTVAASSGTSSG